MTSTRRGRPPAKPQTLHFGRGRPSRPVVIGIAAGGAVAAVALAFTSPGATGLSACHRFLEYYSGVFSLVALSLTVMGGIAATDRLLLLIPHRVLLQAVHRATATAAVGFLAIHIAMKVAEGHASVVDVVIPFLAPHRAAFIGLGTIAAYFMIIAAWTGIVRSRFTESTRPWLWRALHSAAYACWPIAILHGLKAGRPAAGWVTASYALCVILVGLALLVRVSVMWGRRLRAPKASTTSSIPRIPREPGGPAMARSFAIPMASDPIDASAEAAPVHPPATSAPAPEPTSVPAPEPISIPVATPSRTSGIRRLTTPPRRVPPPRYGPRSKESEPPSRPESRRPEFPGSDFSRSDFSRSDFSRSDFSRSDFSRSEPRRPVPPPRPVPAPEQMAPAVGVHIYPGTGGHPVVGEVVAGEVVVGEMTGGELADGPGRPSTGAQEVLRQAPVSSPPSVQHATDEEFWDFMRGGS